MIKILGAKRVFILSALIAVNALAGIFVYSYLLPEKERVQGEFGAAESRYQALNNEIAELQIEVQEFEEKRGFFERLEAEGFFGKQDRRVVEDIFRNAESSSKVISAVMSIEPGVIENNEVAKRAAYKVLKSQIKINIKAMDDRDIYRYLQILRQSFPGYLSLTSLIVDKELDLDRSVLKKIAAGEDPELISAELMLSWRTMIPDEVPDDSGL